MVLCKTPEGGPTRTGPTKLLTWGWGYACVLSDSERLCIPSQLVKPYHGMVETLRISSNEPGLPENDSEWATTAPLFQDGRSLFMDSSSWSHKHKFFAPDITWGSLKRLSNQAVILLQHNDIAYAPNSHLMAMISVIHKNSICVTLILLLAFNCPGQAQYSY